MATTEDIISMVVIIIVLLVAGLLFTKSYSKTVIKKESYISQFTLKDSYGTSFNTLLGLTESKTRRSFGDLLGSAVYYRTHTVVTPSGQLDIEEEFTKALDVIFPRGNYFFQLDHVIQSMNITFIVDGSNSTRDESERLASSMPSILAELAGAEELKYIDISVAVKILHWSNSSWCENYTVPCSYYSYNEMYYNKSFTVFDMAKYQHGLTRPYYFDEEDEVWRSDWETAMASMALASKHFDMQELLVYFPLTDSLPAATQYFYPCPDDYATVILPRDLDILGRRNIVVNPIFSVNVEPVFYCNDKVVEQMEALAMMTRGHVIQNRNFRPRIREALAADLNQIRMQAGKKRPGDQYAFERQLPMPNGRFAKALIIIYPN